jgi:hypothetical protein
MLSKGAIADAAISDQDLGKEPRFRNEQTKKGNQWRTPRWPGKSRHSNPERT